MKKAFILSFLFILSFNLQAQLHNGSIIVGEDKAVSTPFFSATAGWTFPFGEMQNRYESFMNINATLGWKTEKNCIWNLEFAFQFG